MARSSYIYVVQDLWRADGVVAAFTVKHGLETWIRKRGGLHHTRVIRIRAVDQQRYIMEALDFDHIG